MYSSNSTHVSWNKGKLVGQKVPLTQQQAWSIRMRLETAGNPRILALFKLAIDSKPRACDLLGLRVRDIANGLTVQSRGKIVQQKTGRPVRFELTNRTKDSVAAWNRFGRLNSEDFLFPSRQHHSPHLPVRQHARLVKEWTRSIGLDPMRYGTHTMGRIRATLIYRRTKNLRAEQLLLGHSEFGSTVRYLGIEMDGALEMSEQIGVSGVRRSCGVGLN